MGVQLQVMPGDVVGNRQREIVVGGPGLDQ